MGGVRIDIIYTTMYKITNEALLYSTGTSTQSSVVTKMGR